MSRGQFPATRMRRNRMKAFSRRLFVETRLSVDDLIWPLFVTEGDDRAEPVTAMPGVMRHSIDKLVAEADVMQLLHAQRMTQFMARLFLRRHQRSMLPSFRQY